MTTADDPRHALHAGDTLELALAWLAVGVPLPWGVVQTSKKAMALFA
jgi:hypothetical protein